MTERFYISDEDVSQEIDNTDDDFMRIRVQERTNPDIEEFSTFLNNPSFIMPKGSQSTNLINLQTGISYDIPGNKINRFFDYLERIRRSRTIGLKWEERQYYTGSEYSGIMIDLDIYQSDARDQFNTRTYNLLLQHISIVLRQYLQIEKYQNEDTASINVVILRRPKISRKSEEEPYKDGLHILLPGVKVRKEVKKLIIKSFCNPNADFFKVLKIVKPANGHKDDKCMGHQCVDLGSATVAVFLFGCERREGYQPYVLDKFYEINFAIINEKIMDPSITEITDKYYYYDDSSNPGQKTSLWIQEFSLHWEVAHGPKTSPVIKKYNYDIRSEYKAEAAKFVAKTEHDYDNNAVYGDLDIRRLNDAETEFYQALLDTLDPKRSELYMYWFDVLCVLAHAKGDRKSLAQYFSQKCPTKYNPTEFEIYWKRAKDNQKNMLNVGSLCFWAQEDNPERYKEVCNRHVHTELLQRIFNSAAEGILGHYDIASLMYSCMRYKYTYSPDMNVWYECVTEDDDHRPGELFKWRLLKGGQPSSMRNYLSVIMPELFMRALKTINISYTKAVDPREAKYYFNIMKNFKSSYRKLKDSGFKTQVVREAQDLYSDWNFMDKLDKEGSVLPVANGILVLGRRIKFINGYHNYIVSKYAPTNYMPFNPRHPMIKKILYLYRNLFPDDEPDTHEFFMCLYARCLDGLPKEQIFINKVGGGKNGKTVTTEIHRSVMGPSFATTLPIQFITGGQKRDAESSTPTTMAAINARSADYQESDKAETLSAAKVKLLTGGGFIGGRENYGEYKQIKLVCYHIVDTNYEFKVNDNSHGFWRRLQYITMKMRFHSKHEMYEYNENNPYHRIAEDLDDLIEDSEFKSAYLAVMCHYYERIHRLYNGCITNIPRPHIEKDTLAYRNRQNKLNMFYTKFLVRCNNEEKNTKLLIDEIRGRYERWYRTIAVVDNNFKDGLEREINESVIGGLIQKDPYGPSDYIQGFRLREFNDTDELKEGETLFEGPKRRIKIDIKPESWDQYYERICHEYDEDQQNYIKEIKSDSIGQTMPIKEHNVSIPTMKNTNIEGYASVDDVINKKQINDLINMSSEKVPVKKVVAKKSQPVEIESENESTSDSESESDSEYESE
jgi:hypothetical protein